MLLPSALKPIPIGLAAVPRAIDLCQPVPQLQPGDPTLAAQALFESHRDLISLPVVDGNRALGLIKRRVLQSEMAKPFRRELFEKKSCAAFMDAAPLVIEADTTIEQTARLVADSGSGALADGFIIARDGAYLGVGSGLDLMRTVADLQQARNRQIMQSIDYASVIQRAMLRTSLDTLQAALPGSVMVWEPRDTVGGDFFLCAQFDGGTLVVVADCTGHGVPGAFMTLISSSWLGQALERFGPSDPALLLGELNRKIKQSLGQVGKTDADGQSDDGLDAIVLWLDASKRRLVYAGARTPLHQLRAGQTLATTRNTDRVGVGYVATPADYVWQNHELDLQSGDLLFAATDGLTDQVGGERGIAFGKRRLCELLGSLDGKPATEVAAVVSQAHRDWQGWNRRRDDLSFFCLRLS